MKKNALLAVVLCAIVGAIWYLEAGKARPNTATGPSQSIAVTPQSTQGDAGTSTASGSAPSVTLKTIGAADMKSGDQPAVEFSDPTGFVNTSTSKLADLVGKKVVLLDFWTYSCINCIRTVPYLNAWYQKYRNQGLEIVGIHTPEFDFEKNIDNVKAAVAKFGIQYPVVLDSNYGTWQAYKNLYWPHEYLIDLAGYVVHDQIGEGNYGETEAEIQRLLSQRASVLGMDMPSVTSSAAASIPVADLSGLGSPETYFGAARNQYLANGTPGKTGIQSFTESVTIAPNALYLLGTWNIGDQYAETPSSVGGSQVGSDRIDYRYRSKGVYFVAGSADNSPIDIEVLRDGKPIDIKAAGADIFYKDGRSYVRVTGNRLYRIIDDVSAGDHFLEFIISSPGLQAYTFTFG